jgi:hypothetical protein
VTSAAILDFRIFPEKSEEKKDIKKLSVKNYFFQLKSMDKQVDKNNLYMSTLPLKNCKRIIESQQKPSLENSRQFPSSEVNIAFSLPYFMQIYVNECPRHVWLQ